MTEIQRRNIYLWTYAATRRLELRPGKRWEQLAIVKVITPSAHLPVPCNRIGVWWLHRLAGNVTAGSQSGDRRDERAVEAQVMQAPLD